MNVSESDRRGGSHLFASEEWRQIGDSLGLSPRELQIIRGIFDDSKELAIARELEISPHTVHTYLERIYRKLEVNSRVQVVLRVVVERMELGSRTEARPVSFTVSTEQSTVDKSSSRQRTSEQTTAQ